MYVQNKANRKSRSIELKDPWGGTGHVIYNNSLYYNRFAILLLTVLYTHTGLVNVWLF